MKIGVLAAQGAFAEHITVLIRLEIDIVPVRLPRDLDGLDGLIIPGGESTSISKLMRDYNLTGEIKKLAEDGLPVFGTCAGMILLADDVPDSEVTPMGLMNIRVRRNAFGRQKESFETELTVPALGEKPYHAVFIRAPKIEQVDGGVEVLAKLSDKTVVAVRQGKLLATAFHPELTDDSRFHRYFLDIVAGKSPAT
ncbi:MAG: pyridoxal 5'-phosphate synthase glutaminase subunit PdxT [Dehalococcoidales bacterium]|nr:pyridoxal 5'-phosphate synthase glutaminase subunit PdxT [Dehalococcoidales bacterium]